MALSSRTIKSGAVAALAAVSLATGLVGNPGQAEARYRPGAAIAAGVVGALVTGAIIASAQNRYSGYSAYEDDYSPYGGYAPQPYYGRYAPAPVYVEPGYGYAPAYRPAYGARPYYGYEGRHHYRHHGRDGRGNPYAIRGEARTNTR